MCLQEITCCDPAIISIMFLHGEDMQPSGIHGKKGVDMIVQMDADECEKAGSFAVLSLSEIKSERIDDAIHPGSADRECGQRPERRAKPAHPCPAISACEPRCNFFDTI